MCVSDVPSRHSSPNQFWCSVYTRVSIRASLGSRPTDGSNCASRSAASWLQGTSYMVMRLPWTWGTSLKALSSTCSATRAVDLIFARASGICVLSYQLLASGVSSPNSAQTQAILDIVSFLVCLCVSVSLSLSLSLSSLSLSLFLIYYSSSSYFPCGFSVW